MSLSIDADALLDTARSRQQQARQVADTPLPVRHDPVIARAREAAATVVADVTDLAGHLVRLVRTAGALALAARLPTEAFDCLTAAAFRSRASRSAAAPGGDR